VGGENMKVWEYIEMLKQCHPDAEVIAGAQDANKGVYFAWRKEPRIVEPAAGWAVLPNAVYLQGIGDVLVYTQSKKEKLVEPEVVRAVGAEEWRGGGMLRAWDRAGGLLRAEEVGAPEPEPVFERADDDDDDDDDFDDDGDFEPDVDENQN
jgi:hypothetical protein